MATLKQLDKKVAGLTAKRDRLAKELADTKVLLNSTRDEANAAKKAAKEAAPKAVKAKTAKAE